MAHRSAEIVKELEQEIMNAEFLPGQRLPVQQRRGVGLLRALKLSGSYIADPSLENLADAVHTYSVLTSADSYLELMDFRIVLETECARLAASNAGEKIIEILKLAQSKMERSKGNQIRFSSADIAFHLAIAAGSKNNLFATVLSGLEKPSIEYATANRGDSKWYDSVIDTHAEILTAIEEGNGDKAADSMKRHLILSRRHYVDLDPS